LVKVVIMSNSGMSLNRSGGKNRQVLSAPHHKNPVDYLKESSFTILKVHHSSKMGQNLWADGNEIAFPGYIMHYSIDYMYIRE